MQALVLVFFAGTVSSTLASEECGSGPRECTSWSKYRSYDGSCNNLEHPKWGSALSEYGRLLPSKFSDSKMFFYSYQRFKYNNDIYFLLDNGSLPVSISGKPLPNARKISTTLYLEKEVEDTILSLLAVAYGQIVSHDLGFALACES